jgi:hypothetical protein
MILAITHKRCSQCNSYITYVERDHVIECGICDFVRAAIAPPDAMIAKAVRLSESVDRVEVVLSHF